MKLSTTTVALAGALCLTSVAQSQVLTELRISTAGLDQEYAEIRGTAGQSTDGLMILAVEGDPGGSTGGVGTLDKVYDLSGNTFPGDFYVMGSAEADAAFPGNIHASFGDNLFENSSATFYLVLVPNATLRADIMATWMGTDVSDPIGSLTTRMATDPGVTILDAVAITDGGIADVFYDGAPIFGPDPNFTTSTPAGIIRNGGCPGDWCSDVFIDFGNGGGATLPFVDPSPNAINPTTTCMSIPSAGNCGGSNGLGTAYCMTNANSTNTSGVLSAAGSGAAANNDVTLTGSSLPLNSFGFFLASLDAGFVANPGGSAGNLCLGGSIGRYVGPGQIKNTGQTGEFSLVLDLTSIPQPNGPVAVMGGDTWRFQAWHRDAVGGVAGSNFTNGLEVLFQ